MYGGNATWSPDQRASPTFDRAPCFSRQKRDDAELELIGVTLMGFGVVIAFLPGTGELTIIWVIAAFASLVGIFLVAFGLRLRTWNRTTATVRRFS